jgi:ankyrin repeat protein
VLSNSAVVEILIKNGAHTEIKNNHGNTPLIEALHYQRSENIFTLLESGADPNNGNDSGGFPLLYIMEFDHDKWIEMAAALLQYGADINKRTYEGMTCLHFAIYAGHYEYTKYLLENGADVNAETAIDPLLPSDFLAYITKNYTDIVESTEEDALLRQKMRELLEDYGAEFRPIPNTISRFGCIYTTLGNSSTNKIR